MLSKSLNINLLKNQSENEIKKKLTKIERNWSVDMRYDSHFFFNKAKYFARK